MKFRLTTDKGTFISINEKDLQSVQLVLSLSHNLVHSLYKGNIDSYSDDVKGLMVVLNQMFLEMNQSAPMPDIKFEVSVEPLTEKEADDIMQSDTFIKLESLDVISDVEPAMETPETIVESPPKNNVVSISKFLKKD